MPPKPKPAAPAAMTQAQRQARLRERQNQRLADYVEALERIARFNAGNGIFDAVYAAEEVLEKWKS